MTKKLHSLLFTFLFALLLTNPLGQTPTINNHGSDGSTEILGDGGGADIPIGPQSNVLQNPAQ